MSSDLPPPDRATARAGGRSLVLGGAVVLLLGIGWFVWSHFVNGAAAADAFGEALGVVLGLLIVVSVVGAVTASRNASE